MKKAEDLHLHEIAALFDETTVIRAIISQELRSRQEYKNTDSWQLKAFSPKYLTVGKAIEIRQTWKLKVHQGKGKRQSLVYQFFKTNLPEILGKEIQTAVVQGTTLWR